MTCGERWVEPPLETDGQPGQHRSTKIGLCRCSCHIESFVDYELSGIYQQFAHHLSNLIVRHRNNEQRVEDLSHLVLKTPLVRSQGNMSGSSSPLHKQTG